jgi:hypothetical protein
MQTEEAYRELEGEIIKINKKKAKNFRENRCKLDKKLETVSKYFDSHQERWENAKLKKAAEEEMKRKQEIFITL